MNFRLSKCKQVSPTHFVWKTSAQQREKKYLHIQLAPKAIVYFSSETEESQDKNQSGAQIFRKYTDGCYLAKAECSSDVIVLTFQHQKMWRVIVDLKNPITLNLVRDDNVSILRCGANGVFTKPKKFETSFNELSSFNISEVSQTTQKKDILEISQYQRNIRNFLARKLKTLNKTAKKSEQKIPLTQDLEEVKQKIAELQDLSAREVKNQFDGKLLDKSFIQLKKMQRSMTEGTQRLSVMNQQMNQIQDALTLVRSEVLNTSQLDEISQKFQIPREKKVAAPKAEVKQSFRVFVVENNVKILVGRTSEENDIITKKAQANDYWFHAVNAAGSHVIIPLKSLPDQMLTPACMRKALILAIHFSKLSATRSGEVYMTKRQHLRKQKGMALGLWQVLSCETIFVSYEKDELDILFN